MNQWAESTHARIAATIKALRGSRSQQWLADRTAELGYPITRAQIANCESGRKQALDIAELIVIAEALGTSPAAIVSGSLDGDSIEYLPGQTLSPHAAWEQFTGQDQVQRQLAILDDIKSKIAELF